MSLKKNIAYSTILTLSTYLVPLLIFPYISRILGAENIGAIDFVDNIINYSVMLSMMGTTTLGIRETAKNRDNPEKLRQAFADLFSLNIISTTIVAIILCIIVYTSSPLQEKWELFCVGGIKLIANLFWIEWFFKGIENFRYITIRYVVLRLLFVLSVFLFVHTKSDYLIYYSLFVALTLGNAVCNWHYKQRYVSLSLNGVNLKRYAKPFFQLGFFAIFSSIYTQLIAVWLGLECGDRQVGFYTTATRLYQVIIALFSTLTSVFIPHMSVLFKENRLAEIKQTVMRSYQALYLFAFPVISFTELFAHDLIFLIAGTGFEPAAFPMRIVMLLTLVIGAEQIYILQLLIPMQKEHDLLRAVISGVVVCAIAGCLLISRLQSIGAAITWTLSEFTVLLIASYYVKKYLNISYPFSMLGRFCLLSLPYWASGFVILWWFDHAYIRLAAGFTFFVIYTIILEEFILQLRIIPTILQKIKSN